jgi:hypothetical protein
MQAGKALTGVQKIEITRLVLVLPRKEQMLEV